jgi:hypothetical protein
MGNCQTNLSIIGRYVNEVMICFAFTMPVLKSHKIFVNPAIFTSDPDCPMTLLS